MISSKRFSSVDGATSRFLSDFIIQSEQHCRVYMYIYNPSCSLDTSCDTISNGVYIREVDAPQTPDLVTLDKWDLVDNSIVFYTTPITGCTIVIEVATTPEEFGEVVAMPIIAAAQSYADSATIDAASAAASASSAATSATTATSAATSASSSATSASASATSANLSKIDATTSASTATNKATEAAASASSAATSATTATTQAGIATSGATTATTQAGIATTQASNASASATSAQLMAWEAEAEKLTADSYAIEAEDVFVKIYTSNGDGTFTSTPTTVYSSLHWAAKSALTGNSITSIDASLGTIYEGLA